MEKEIRPTLIKYNRMKARAKDSERKLGLLVKFILDLAKKIPGVKEHILSRGGLK